MNCFLEQESWKIDFLVSEGEPMTLARMYDVTATAMHKLDADVQKHKDFADSGNIIENY